jgi:hypothetical protein
VLITLFSSTHTFHLLAWQNTDFVGMRIPAPSSPVETSQDGADSPTINFFTPLYLCKEKNTTNPGGVFLTTRGLNRAAHHIKTSTRHGAKLEKF